MTALATKPSLTLVRRLKATPSSVYAAWTDPKILAQWFGPHHTHIVSAETDVRVGGKFRVVMRETKSGELHDVSGVYRVVEPERKLVFSWAWVSIPERESLVTVSLHPVSEGVELTLLHEQFFDEHARVSHNRGWTESLERLERLLT